MEDPDNFSEKAGGFSGKSDREVMLSYANKDMYFYLLNTKGVLIVDRNGQMIGNATQESDDDVVASGFSADGSKQVQINYYPNSEIRKPEDLYPLDNKGKPIKPGNIHVTPTKPTPNPVRHNGECIGCDGPYKPTDWKETPTPQEH